MRIETDSNDKVQLIIKKVVRDPKTNKLKYETVRTINVLDATGEQVVAHIEKSFQAQPRPEQARPATR